MMNEHIQKLSNIWANRRAIDENLGVTYTFSEKALSKFAEMVIKECALCSSNDKDVIRMYERFGVK